MHPVKLFMQAEWQIRERSPRYQGPRAGQSRSTNDCLAQYLPLTIRDYLRPALFLPRQLDDVIAELGLHDV
jgi:hypothetical protein